MPDPELSCPSCGTPFQDRYCAACGEKRMDAHDLSVGHYWHELLHGFTHADGKLVKTLRALLLRPGELSRAYMEGRRVQYMRPVNLFVVLNLIYFLFPLFEVFNTSLYSQLYSMPHSGPARALVAGTLTATGATEEAYAVAYAMRSSANAKLMLLVLVFILAGLFGLLFFRKTKWASGHVTFALESMSFSLLFTAIGMGLLLTGAMAVVNWAGGDAPWLVEDALITSLAALLYFYFHFVGARRFYRCSIAGAAWRAVVGIVLMFVALTIYRLLLFLVTHWQVARALGEG